MSEPSTDWTKDPEIVDWRERALVAEAQATELVTALRRLIRCRVYADPDGVTDEARTLLDRVSPGWRDRGEG